MRQILHIDVNNAFLSWTAVELLKNGELLDIRNIPSIIGGDESKRTGIVIAKSQPAKATGIITGEPIFKARQKCPEIKSYNSKYSVYTKYSDMLYNLLIDYTDKIERYSIDECFLDMTDYLMGSTIQEVAQNISNRVKEELGFTVNIGISENKLLAKMASEFEKPDKIHTLYKSEIKHKMWSLDVNELFMLGKKTAQKLKILNINTIGELAKVDINFLVKHFGKYGKMISDYSKGIDEEEVNSNEQKPKGIGNSVTLPKDIYNQEKLLQVLLGITEQVCERLRKQDMIATAVTVQLRTNKFKDYTHQKKVEQTASTKKIYDIVKELFYEMYKGEPIRLVGVRVSKLIDKNETQLSFFEENQKRQDKIDETLDNINKKYGITTMSRAAKLDIEKYLRRKE